MLHGASRPTTQRHWSLHDDNWFVAVAANVLSELEVRSLNRS